jgi:putative endonuclease
MQTTKQKGDLWEVIAIKYLQRNDYRILETNYKFGRFWEIDVIAQKNDIFYFIEVKYRSSQKYGTAEESITKSKLYKLEKSIYSYCMKKRIDLDNISFQVITIVKGQTSNKLTHYKNICLS